MKETLKMLSVFKLLFEAFRNQIAQDLRCIQVNGYSQCIMPGGLSGKVKFTKFHFNKLLLPGVRWVDRLMGFF